MVYANFFKRAVAYLIDLVLIGIANFLLSYFGGLIGSIVTFVLRMTYFILLEGGEKGATLGKQVMKIRVVNADGNSIGYGKAALRYLGRILSGFLLMFGYFMALFTSCHQALHDKIASSFVVDAESLQLNQSDENPLNVLDSNERQSLDVCQNSDVCQNPDDQNNMRCIAGISGEYQGRTIPIPLGGVCIGRDPSVCQLALDPNTAEVSRQHCQVSCDPQTGMVVIMDMGSTFGTYLENGQRLVPMQPQVVYPGTRFYLGNPENTFVIM